MEHCVHLFAGALHFVKDIIMHSLFLYTQYLLIAEAMAAVAGCITWRKWKHTYLKWFVVYLLIITCLELSNHLLIYFNEEADIAFVNNLIVPFEILFINWFFYQTLNDKNRKVVIPGVILYIVSLILENTIVTNTGYYFKSLSYTVGNLFILIYLILFFLELVNSEKILAFKRLAVFWIALGMLIFYLGTFPFFGLYNEIVKQEYRDFFIKAAWIETSLNYSMYLLFTTGFIWGKTQ